MMLPGFLRVRLAQAAVVAAFAAAPLVSCTTDEIVAFESAPDGGTTLPAGGDAAVKVDGVPAAGSCPGAPIVLTSPTASRRVGGASGDTASSGSSFESAACGGGNGKDVVYSLTFFPPDPGAGDQCQPASYKPVVPIALLPGNGTAIKDALLTRATTGSTPMLNGLRRPHRAEADHPVSLVVRGRPQGDGHREGRRVPRVHQVRELRRSPRKPAGFRRASRSRARASR